MCHLFIDFYENRFSSFCVTLSTNKRAHKQWNIGLHALAEVNRGLLMSCTHWCTVAIVAECASSRHHWLIHVTVGLEPRFAGRKSFALMTELRRCSLVFSTKITSYAACGGARQYTLPVVVLARITGSVMLPRPYGSSRNRRVQQDRRDKRTVQERLDTHNVQYPRLLLLTLSRHLWSDSSRCKL